MRLFADDDLRDDWGLRNPEPLEALRRILPTRCPEKVPTLDAGRRQAQVSGSERACPDCDGRGFLYPPMPEWWGGPFDGQHAWEGSCEDMWRAMGILEGDD